MFLSSDIENSLFFCLFVCFGSNVLSHAVVEFVVVFLSLISGKTHTLMAPDGITAGVIERCFKRITQDGRHDYKVQQ